MARTDAIVLGAGIVGTSIALHLAKRGLAVALVDRRGPGEETSYGNAGVIEGNTLFPHPFPESFSALMRVALKQATEANYHLGVPAAGRALAAAYRANSAPRAPDRIRASSCGRCSRCAVAEHEALMAEAGATRYLRKNGWLKLYRSEAAFAATARERELATAFDLPHQALDRDGALALEPALAPVFARALYWPEAASVTNPLAVTRAYAARFAALGGVMLMGDARTLHAHRTIMAGRHRRGADRRAKRLCWRSGRGRPMCWTRSASSCRSRSSAAITCISARGQRQCRADAAGRRCRARLLRRADGAGAPPHHRRGIRAARRAADAGAVRPAAAGGAGAFPLGRADRSDAVDGEPPVLCGFPSGDRPRAGTARPVARLRPRALGADARPGDRPADGGTDHGDAVLRSRPFRAERFRVKARDPWRWPKHHCRALARQ